MALWKWTAIASPGSRRGDERIEEVVGDAPVVDHEIGGGEGGVDEQRPRVPDHVDRHVELTIDRLGEQRDVVTCGASRSTIELIDDTGRDGVVADADPADDGDSHDVLLVRWTARISARPRMTPIRDGSRSLLAGRQRTIGDVPSRSMASRPATDSRRSDRCDHDVGRLTRARVRSRSPRRRRVAPPSGRTTPDC